MWDKIWGYNISIRCVFKCIEKSLSLNPTIRHLYPVLMLILYEIYFNIILTSTPRNPKSSNFSTKILHYFLIIRACIFIRSRDHYMWNPKTIHTEKDDYNLLIFSSQTYFVIAASFLKNSNVFDVKLLLYYFSSRAKAKVRL